MTSLAAYALEGGSATSWAKFRVERFRPGKTMLGLKIVSSRVTLFAEHASEQGRMNHFKLVQQRVNLGLAINALEE